MAYKKIKKGRIMSFASKIGDVIDEGADIVRKGHKKYDTYMDEKEVKDKKKLRRLKLKNQIAKEKKTSSSKWDNWEL